MLTKVFGSMPCEKGDAIAFDILFGRREYFIKKVKAPLVRGLVHCFDSSLSILSKIRLFLSIFEIVIAVSRYPKPTKGNTKKRSTHVLLDIWEEFERYNEVKKDLFRAIKVVSIDECEHDRDYETRMLWFFQRLAMKYLRGELMPLEPWQPLYRWNELSVLESRKKLGDKIHANI